MSVTRALGKVLSPVSVGPPAALFQMALAVLGPLSAGSAIPPLRGSPKAQRGKVTFPCHTVLERSLGSFLGGTLPSRRDEMLQFPPAPPGT